MENEHQTWLIASNPSKYNITDAFESNEVITWGLTSKLNVGDMVYVYLSAPNSCIKYRCTVDKVNVIPSERLGAEFWMEEFNPNRNLINLKLMAVMNDDKLQLNYLIEHGLMSSAPQGPRRVRGKLNDFLDGL